MQKILEAKFDFTDFAKDAAAGRIWSLGRTSDDW